jgi:hypothetical protein
MESATVDNVKKEPFKTIEIRCQAMKKCYGLVDHYFYVIDDKEYHTRLYPKGRILERDTTKGYHVVAYYDVCEECYTKIAADFLLKEDVRIFNYFPLLNCETFCTGISVQSLLLISIPFILYLVYRGRYLYAIILCLVMIIILLAYSKYIFSRTKKIKCSHLKS